jgi:hypothetical protein
MILSLLSFARHKEIHYLLSNECYLNILNSPCSFCKKNENPKKKTYKNVGLHNWKLGYNDNNVFPLCKLCYTIRNGDSKKQLMHNVSCIVFRTPIRQKMSYIKQDKCKKYDGKKLCRGHRCNYCHASTNLTIDKIDASKMYTKRNTQTLCWTCNRMKSNLKESTFFKHIKRLWNQSLLN